MKSKLFFPLLLFASLFSGNALFAQEKPKYNLPDNYRFDYEVKQVVVNNKNTADTCTMHFFYTKSGDYAGAGFNGKGDNEEKLFVVLTRESIAIIFDQQKKNITIVNIHKLISDLGGLLKRIKMDSLVAQMRQKTNGKNIQSVKTGNTKQIDSYTAEEYSVSDNKDHKVSVWCAKVDFFTPGDYILGAGGSNLLRMMKDRMTSHPLLLALTQPKTLVTEIDRVDSRDAKGIAIRTESIKQNPKTILTTGYKVKNYSNMTLPEIFQAEMGKKGN
jgi:hypothetical protein